MEFFRLEKGATNLPKDVFGQVSALITGYVQEHPGEMLIKTPTEIEQTFTGGNSVIAIHPENPNLVIGYAALYPFGLNEVLNEELFEFGSWIIHPDFRHHRINGQTLGEYVAQNLIDGKEEPIIATVKRFNTLRALIKLGFKPVKFQDYPCVSSLTCVCPSSSEHHGFNQCQHRSINPGEIVNGTSQTEPPKIACTLLGYNLEKLTWLEQQLQQQLGLVGQSLNYNLFQIARQGLEERGLKIL
ncbi:MAG: hypothetical protein ACPLRN_02185 [Microgenomates group bacterium]